MSAEPDYRASTDPEWQPYRNAVGEVVTLTPDHCSAIAQALMVYKRVTAQSAGIGKDGRHHDGPVFDVDTAIGILGFLRAKSCLMGRLLYDGKPPLVDPPPVKYAAPDYSVEARRGPSRGTGTAS